jgi:tol-pal system protein YbgF
MRAAITLAAGLGLLTPALTTAADLEGRVTRIENILENQRGSDLLLQIQRLQAEIALLRGTVEQQKFDLEVLQRQQKEQYLDLDGRLRALGGAQAPPAPAQRSSVPGDAPAAGDAMLMPRSQSSAAPAGRATASGAASPDLALPPPEGRGRDAEREAYREAFDLLKQRRYDDAAAAFRALLSRYPRGELADNARYWLGETYYVKRDYAAALAEFQRVLDDYPLSPKVAGSMLKIGYIQDERKEWPRARTTLERLIDKFPDSTEARLAQGRLERMARDGH